MAFARIGTSEVNLLPHAIGFCLFSSVPSWLYVYKSSHNCTHHFSEASNRSLTSLYPPEGSVGKKWCLGSALLADYLILATSLTESQNHTHNDLHALHHIICFRRLRSYFRLPFSFCSSLRLPQHRRSEHRQTQNMSLLITLSATPTRIPFLIGCRTSTWPINMVSMHLLSTLAPIHGSLRGSQMPILRHNSLALVSNFSFLLIWGKETSGRHSIIWRRYLQCPYMLIH